MERIPILKLGEFLLVTIQVDMHDRLAMTLQNDVTDMIVKTGARGAIGLQDWRRFESTVANLSVFDTIGAGDSFNAGYLLARLSGQDLQGALRSGCSAATSVISRFPRRNIKRGELADALAFADARLCAQQ